MHPLKCASSFILKSEISAYWHSHVIIRRGLALESAVQTSFSGLFNT